MVGDLSRRDRKRLARLVSDAEAGTGLQLVVYLGPTEVDPAAHAEELLARAGAGEQPAVLLLVAPEARRIEVRTSAAVQDRFPDEAAARAVAAMEPLLASGDLVAGVAAGLAVLVATAGPPRLGSAKSAELPDLL